MGAVMTRQRYDPEAIFRALDAHKANGLIRDWRRIHEDPAWDGKAAGWPLLVDLVDGDSYYELRTVREAAVFCAALASAHHAHLRAATARAIAGAPPSMIRDLTPEHGRRLLDRVEERKP